MTDFVHFLIRSPAGKRGLLYPSEIDIPEFYSVGSFYLMGIKGSRLADSYTFHAVQKDNIIVVQLKAAEGTSYAFYRAIVEGVGNILFYAQSLSVEYPYLGSNPGLLNNIASRRLRAWKPYQLDALCEKHQFYFVGYSPRIEGE